MNGGDDAAIEAFFNDPVLKVSDEERQELINKAKVEYDTFRESAPEGLRRSLAAETSDLLQFQGLQNVLNKDIARKFALDKIDPESGISDDEELSEEYIARNFPSMKPFIIKSLPIDEINEEAVARREESNNIEASDSGFTNILLNKIKDSVKQSAEDMGIISPFRAFNDAAKLKEAILGDRTPIQGAKEVFRFVTSSENIKRGIRSGELKARDVFDRLLKAGMVVDSDFAEFVRLFRKEQDTPEVENTSQ